MDCFLSQQREKDCFLETFLIYCTEFTVQVLLTKYYIHIIVIYNCACPHVRMLACWHAGMLACWHVGMLACWQVGMLACWQVGMLWFDMTLTNSM